MLSASLAASLASTWLSRGEELYFRGIIQNLLTPGLGAPVAQLIASLLFDLPRERYALVAAVAGWFYGRTLNAEVSSRPA